MSKDVKKIKVSLDTLSSCYPNLTQGVVIHALQAIDSGNLSSQYIGSYLKHLDDYFCNRGDIRYDGYGLIPENSEIFLNKKLTAWLDFWSVDEGSRMAEDVEAMIHNQKVWAEMAKD